MEYLVLVITSVVSVVAMFLIAKLMGRKSITQMTLFDYITGISVGSIAAEMATELEEPQKPLIAMFIYGIIAFFVSILTNKSIKARKMLSVVPSVILKDCVIYRENMKKAKIDTDDFLMMCRTAGYFDITQLQAVLMEHNGKLSFLPYPERRPATPFDLSVTPESECIMLNVVTDGQICEKALQKSGHNIDWLMKRLSEQGFKDLSEVFLAVCDDKGSLSVYRGKDS